MSLVAKSITTIGVRPLARHLGVFPNAVVRWRRWDRLPKTELAGLTNYAVGIAELLQDKGSPVSAEELVAHSRKRWVSQLARR